MEIKDNVIYFDDDDEITNYCLSNVAEITPCQINNKTYYGYDYPFTAEYNDAIANGKQFCVRNPNSLVTKHKAVNRGVITKKICNLICD